MATKTKKNNYDSEDIQVLEGLEAIRKRPGMYIGGTNINALHHMVYEVLDNSVDEIFAGGCNLINIIIGKDNSITVSDNGRGIPVSIHPKFKKSSLELIFTKLHSGGKFGGNGYKISGGLHGVGLSVVNALSDWVEVTVNRDGGTWFLKIENGVVLDGVKEIGKSNETGTSIKFLPDKDIFDTIVFNAETLIERFKEIAFLNKGLTIKFEDQRDKPIRKELFFYEGGLKHFIEDINTTTDVLHKQVLAVEGSEGTTIVECALQYTTDYEEIVYSFVNNIKTIDGGSHVVGFKSALQRAINDCAREKNILKQKDTNLTGEDIREGLTAIVSIKMEEPQFEGQTKGKLSNSEIKPIVEDICYKGLLAYFANNTSMLNIIVKKAKEAAKAREAAKLARQINRKKNSVESGEISSKLAHCSSKIPEECELYLVEGDSAGGSAKQGRNRRTQAILPLRGKVLNCEKTRMVKILSNVEICTMISTMGAGCGADFDITKARYHKVILMCDADIDGLHINTLLLTFLYRMMKPLITNGYVYLAQPPLYKIVKNKVIHYAYSEKEKEDLVKKLGSNITVQRYKGLGEMNPDQLWETTMNPATRKLVRVKENDPIFTNKVFSTLMGNKVDPRKEFIFNHAKHANVDISNL